jgi:hypothetical protein
MQADSVAKLRGEAEEGSRKLVSGGRGGAPMSEARRERISSSATGDVRRRYSGVRRLSGTLRRSIRSTPVAPTGRTGSRREEKERCGRRHRKGGVRCREAGGRKEEAGSVK